MVHADYSNAALSPDEVYAALREVDAPLPTREDMDRLYQGRMVQILQFVASNVVGRKSVASARRAIHASCGQSRIASAPSVQKADSLHLRVQRAEARVNNTRMAVENLEAELQKPSRSLTRLEGEVDRLQSGLQDKRITTLLLSVLQQKEEIRKQRFEEISQFIHELRSVFKPCMAQLEPDLLECGSTIPGTCQRTEYTRDALASLQSHSIRLTRLSGLAEAEILATRANKLEASLFEVVARSMHSYTGDPEVVYARERICAGARIRAASSIQYHSPIPEATHMEEFEDVYQRIAEKELNLQNLADRAAALTLACARLLRKDHAFVQDTAPQLNEALEGEAAAAQGHVDAQRLSIINRPRAADATGSLKRDSITHGRSFCQTLSVIEHRFTETRDTEAFLNQANSLIGPDSTAVQRNAAIAETYAHEEKTVSRCVENLLERKTAKADAGRALVQDIERLIAEVGIITTTRT
ncbi:hypothetical protein BC628DRAFT_1332859 [Trametes gibbosa]|nr:hypothetical protein BC628DRAFT_1332859 [Trametes gibbosa]